MLTIQFHFTHFPDIDECVLETDNCLESCTNVGGSYNGSCRAGYRLNSDGYSCSGKQKSSLKSLNSQRKVMYDFVDSRY